MHDKKSSKMMKGCWSAVQTNGFTFTHVAALLTEFSVICALLMKKNFIHAELAKPNQNRNIFHKELNQHLPKGDSQKNLVQLSKCDQINKFDSIIKNLSNRKTSG